MIKRFVAQVAVLGVGALALLGLGAVSSMLTRGDTLVGPVATVEVDSAVALAEVKGQLQVTRQELERAHQILDYSGRYSIPADLSDSSW
jgi:hypothetical protein